MSFPLFGTRLTWKSLCVARFCDVLAETFATEKPLTAGAVAALANGLALDNGRLLGNDARGAGGGDGGVLNIEWDAAGRRGGRGRAHTRWRVHCRRARSD
jgi:hypothetical protein